MNNKLYENDYVIFDTKHGEFDFIINDYPYIYATTSVKETILDLCYNDNYTGDCYDNEIENVIFVPTTELPKEIQKKLLNMVINIYKYN